MDAARMRGASCAAARNDGAGCPWAVRRSAAVCSRALPYSRAPPVLLCLADRRRMIVKRRSAPPAQRDKLRYRDEPRGLELDPTSPRFTGRLTTEINSANGPLQLAKLVQEYGLRFSGTQVTMALGRLAAFATFQKLTDEQLAAQARATRRCALLLRQKLADCDLISYARGVYALGRLAVYDPDLMSGVVEEVYDKLNLFAPDGLAALLAGCAALGHRPSDGWLDRFALEVYARFGRFNGQELANVMYGMARLQYTPSAVWSERCLECFRSAMALPAAPPMPPAMVKFAFAVASLQVRPSFNWTTAFIARARPHLDSLSARELAVLLWALSRMLAAAPHLPAPGPADGAVPTAAAGGRPSAPPPGASPRGGAPLDVTAAVSAEGGAAAVTAIAVGLDRTFLDAWYRCAARRMASANAPSLVLSLQALAVLQVYQPPAKYVTGLLAQLRRALPAAEPGASGAARQPSEPREGAAGLLSGPEVVSVLLSLVALRIRPGAEWMESCLAALEGPLPGLSAPVLCDLAWALARLQYQPAPEWLAAFSARCAVERMQLVAPQRTLLVWAFQQLRVTPPGLLRDLTGLDSHQGGEVAGSPGDQQVAKRLTTAALSAEEVLQSKVATLMLEGL